MSSRPIIPVEPLLDALPKFDGFCSVSELHALAERLRTLTGQHQIRIAGTSSRGLPIHHLCFGRGAVKALLVGGPHCNEPIGSLTVAALMHLLHRGEPRLMECGVEWHLVPCIDPDGALLNEGWSRHPFTFERYMKHYYLQAPADQVDTSFPIAYKNLQLDRPSQEARVLKELLDRIRPDFYFPLHNAWTGGAFYFLSHDLGQGCYRDIGRLLRAQDFPLQQRPIWREICTPFADGFVEMFSIKKYYDHLEQLSDTSEVTLPFGAGSWDYLAEIKPEAVSFVAEMGYVRHPDDESERQTGLNFRQFKLRMEADSKYLATVLLEEWENVKNELGTDSPFYRVAVGGSAFPDRRKLAQGGYPLSRYPTQELLFNPHYSRSMTAGDRFNACMVDGGFMFLPAAHQFVRMLKDSPQTSAVRRALDRLEPTFDQALHQISQHVDFEAFSIVDCNTLARIQLGSGLIALNAVLARPAQ